ncbi:MAG: SIS domain-containing protein [Pseudomonadota bacterium]
MTGTDFRSTATWAEISRQPALWRAWSPALAADLPELRGLIDNADAVWLSGAGSSAYIGDLVAAAFGDARRLSSVPSTDLVARPGRLRGRRPLVISFGRSGNSAESVGVLDALDALAPDAPRLNITCNRDSALARRPGAAGRALVLPDAAHDSGFAMTASFTTMLLTALALLDPDAPGADIAAPAAQAEALLPDLTGWAQAQPPAPRIVFLGTGPLALAAREAALKVMELTAGHTASLWDTPLGFRHGPKSFVQRDTKVVLFGSADPHAARYEADLMAELAAQYPDTPQTRIGPGAALDTGPGMDAWTAVLHVLAAQVLAVVWSAALGLNVDDPFAGHGTLSRVVRDVRLYDPVPA